MSETLILGDCLEKMKDIGSGSVDCAILDPPYFKIVNAAWDNQWKEMAHYIDFIRSVTLECKRVLKPNGSLYMFGDDKVIAYIQVELDKHLTLLNSLVWYKTNNQSIKAAPNLRSYAPMTERILFYENIGGDKQAMGEAGYDKECQNLCCRIFQIPNLCKISGVSRKDIASVIVCDYKNMESALAQASNWMLGKNIPNPTDFDRLKTLLPIQGEYEDLRREYEDLRREYEDLRRVFNADSNTLDVIECPIVNSTDNTDHPTTKPLRLIERLISVSTNEGMMVIDPMMGSGTTGVACVHTRRNFIGIEMDEKYFAIAKSRIEGTQLPLL